MRPDLHFTYLDKFEFAGTRVVDVHDPVGLGARQCISPCLFRMELNSLLEPDNFHVFPTDHVHRIVFPKSIWCTEFNIISKEPQVIISCEVVLVSLPIVARDTCKFVRRDDAIMTYIYTQFNLQL